MNELRGRGTNDILIAVVDGLKGFPEAITTVFPDTVVQTCIVHLMRYSMQFASWKERVAMYRRFDDSSRAIGKFPAAPVTTQVDAIVLLCRSITTICPALGTLTNTRRPEASSSKASGCPGNSIRPVTASVCGSRTARARP